ncbi:enoyl-CoA hydratase/isomerase family protein [Aquabacterium sp. A7-Y]|uniref:enoyl-CoA hydratase/isomerase family protein n=1 Tax=Aquabacterium sp. A7-Y TaxID=1349605 RepID=UPI00223CE66F|nr:enoyl-CoA hydratase/isomerase family protein [Aquabacterium sp. A7-Y]MCW7541770.1 enoyl-CoA hydratase/isomerase family protein [Aquabacterium sp. A7-Y]
MSTYRTLHRQDSKGVAVIHFNNPPINLVDRALLVDLMTLTKALESDQDVRVVIFRSAHPDFFLAHYDLAGEIGGKPLALPEGKASPLSALLTRISRLPQVTIGELQGRARGAGSEFLLALDMRFASRERALLGQPEAAIGLLPGAGGTVRLAQMLGRARALEVCLGCNDFDAELAERYGWINRALPHSELQPFVDALARRIAGFPPSSIANVKAVVNRVTEADHHALVEESQRFVSGMYSEETVRRVAWVVEQANKTGSTMEMNMGPLLERYPADI